MAVVRADDCSRYGCVTYGPSGAVEGFEEKGGVRGAGWINAGLYLVGKERVGAIPAGKPVSLEGEVFPRWVGQGIFAFEAPGPFIDIGTPESYGRGEAFFADLAARGRAR